MKKAVLPAGMFGLFVLALASACSGGDAAVVAVSRPETPGHIERPITLEGWQAATLDERVEEWRSMDTAEQVAVMDMVLFQMLLGDRAADAPVTSHDVCQVLLDASRSYGQAATDAERTQVLLDRDQQVAEMLGHRGVETTGVVERVGTTVFGNAVLGVSVPCEAHEEIGQATDILFGMKRERSGFAMSLETTRGELSGAFDSQYGNTLIPPGSDVHQALQGVEVGDYLLVTVRFPSRIRGRFSTSNLWEASDASNPCFVVSFSDVKTWQDGPRPAEELEALATTMRSDGEVEAGAQ